MEAFGFKSIAAAELIRVHDIVYTPGSNQQNYLVIHNTESHYNGIDPFKFPMDRTSPLSKTSNFASAPSTCSTAPLTSVDTPNAGTGLINAAPHIARAVGLEAGGMGPKSNRIYFLE